jgi:hypothetical protein
MANVSGKHAISVFRAEVALLESKTQDITIVVGVAET